RLPQQRARPGGARLRRYRQLGRQRRLDAQRQHHHGRRMIRRTNTASGAYLLKRAEALARSIVARFGKRTEVIDGYIVEGKRVGEQRIATVLDTPCQVVSLDNANDPRGNTCGVGTRDAIDPRTGLVDGPYTLENTAPSWYPIQYRALGFSMAEGSPWAQSIPWRKRFTSQRDA